MRKFYTLCWLLFVLSISGQAQTITIGTFGFSTTDFYGPLRATGAADTAYSRFAYIYNEQAIDGLKHGDTITAFSFMKMFNDRIRYSPNFKIFVRMSIPADFGTGPLNWTSESKATGMVKVYDGDPGQSVTTKDGWTVFKFSTPYVVDTSLGRVNLEILTEYQQERKESLIPWVYQTDFHTPAFVSNNETKYQSGTGFAPDTVRNSNIRKPYLKIHIPRHDTSLRVNHIFALGKAPVLMNTADTIKAWVENEGKKTLYNHPVYVKVSGANKHLDTVYIDSLKPYEERLIYFGNHDSMDRTGGETINVHFDQDKYPTGDSLKQDRSVNYNVYSHVDHTKPYGPGGIGFNGSDGDFVAKFYVDSIQYMNQIKVDFSRLNSTFKLGVWSMDSTGRPGKELYMSDTLYSIIGTNILNLTPKVKIDTAFFVGIRQVGTSNVAFRYQLETPLRPHTFYYTVPAGGTQWVEFNAYTTNFIVGIQPRIQVANDVGVTAIRKPRLSDTIEYSTDSIAPIATVINYGYADQKIPFDVVCEVENEYGQIIYKSTKTITIKAEDTLQVEFDSSLNFRYVRNNTIRVYTKLFNDRVRDNDTLTRSYYVGILHDVYAEGFFSPVDDEQYRLNTDYVKPVARIVNNGIRDKTGIYVTVEALKDSISIYSQTKVVNIAAEGSMIVPFDSFVLSREGRVQVRVYVHNIIDSFPINDTARVFVNVVKSDDIGLLSIIRPKDSSVYHRKDRFTPFLNVRNLGSEDQDSVSIICTITDMDGKVWYKDTSTKKYTFFSTTQEIFDEFTVIDSNMFYDVVFIVHNVGDQDASNDTLRSRIQGRSRFDLGLQAIVAPTPGQKLSYNSTGNNPNIKIHNFGTDPIPASNYIWIEVEEVATGSTYLDSALIPFSIPGDSTFDFNFTKGLLTDKLGDFMLKAWCAVPNDLEQRNDTLRTAFSVEADYSIALVEVLEPTDSQHFEQNVSTIRPSIKIRNSGLKDIDQETPINLFVTFNKAIVRDETIKLSNLGAGRDTTLNFTSYLAGLRGEYKWRVGLNNPTDQISTDDTLAGVYFVGKENDIKAYRLTFPTTDTVLIANEPYAMKAEFINLGDSDQTTLFSVSMQIFDNGNMVYNSNSSTQATAGDTFEVTLTAAFTPIKKTTYDYLVFSLLGTDQDKTNDTIQGTIESKWSVSVAKLNGHEIRLSPNPSSGLVQVSVPAALYKKQYRVSDAFGRIVLEGEFDSTQSEIDMQDASPGIYHFTVLGNTGQTTLRFVISK